MPKTEFYTKTSTCTFSFLIFWTTLEQNKMGVENILNHILTFCNMIYTSRDLRMKNQKVESKLLRSFKFSIESCFFKSWITFHNYSLLFVEHTSMKNCIAETTPGRSGLTTAHHRNNHAQNPTNVNSKIWNFLFFSLYSLILYSWKTIQTAL